MVAPVTCNTEQLSRLVHDELAEGQVELLEDHLDRCESCRSELERLAGGNGWMQDTREFLSDTSEPSFPLLTDSPVHVAEHELHFLEPSQQPGSLGRLGSYEVSGVLGRGGMGIVLRATEDALDRSVAIKVLASPFASQGLARQRFAREAQAAAAVVHPNVMAIHRVEREHDPPYFVMPLVSSETLQDKLDKEGALSVEETLRIACQVADGLAAAHAQGLIHRDIKPANILIEPGTDRALLTDFGLARAVDDVSLTCTGIIAGTPQFMSPEQARGESLNHQADLFSLGSVIQTMVTGRPPFRADSTYGLLKRIAESPHRPLRELDPSLPDWLQALLDRLLTKQAKDRYASAAEVAEDLRACLAHLQQPAHCPLPEDLTTRQPTRREAWTQRATVGGLIILGVALGLQLNYLFQMSDSSSTNSSSQASSAQPSADSAVGQSAESSSGMSDLTTSNVDPSLPPAGIHSVPPQLQSSQAMDEAAWNEETQLDQLLYQLHLDVLEMEKTELFRPLTPSSTTIENQPNTNFNHR